ncbi:asparagine synthase (glutamine-hydrolyzing) [Streptomyces sioyaensis]|uniref:asparagine synthase (glutamine-hydrolyzing) n=1 Tax=Streptomyces sioyaensis TaxID=67364 RepID=A0A4Q1R000_9ACTN|nr:asparagine synthase (glutamine-hydrolyzing) [Streptomyces sioyaensis]MBM4796527.1 asparagine synthase (glutamine-hydrolyzing) [Streptomyces sioyaensis]RXS67726.1 asparagine synthase (glutamine-hydrolyzing) [Streptomyces sioyaensis]
MCGIAGFYGSPLPPQEYETLIHGMLAQIEHRGPDEAGCFLDDRLAMGTVRLSIIDLSTGSQPVGSADGRYWLCYNGELYNYRELREQLTARGFAFRTESDTEVVLNAWVAWGLDCLPRFNGAFAFALYDSVTGELHLVRDRFGKRPLFVARHRGAWLFASEMKAFLAYPDFQFAFDEAQLASVFATWTPLPGQSGYRGIEQIPMGEYLSVRGDEVRRGRWATLDLAQGPAPESEQEAVELVRADLEAAVDVRLRSDVEVGVYASGGLDSSIIAHLAAQRTSGELRTFSIEFEDAEFDESAEQAELAAHLGTRHSTVRVTDEDVADAFPEAVRHAEVPVFRTAFVPMYLLAGHVRSEGIKVVLSGEGADEAFLGYGIFKDTLLLSTWHELDDDTRLRRMSQLYPYLRHFSGEDGHRRMLGLYRQFTEETLPGLFSHQMRFQNGRFAARLLKNPGDPFAALEELVAGEPGYAQLTPVQKAQWLEFRTLLSGYLLSTQGERMALAHGVENRCPFLDPAVVRRAASVNLRFGDPYDEKYLLKRAYAEVLPERIVKKGKFPYRAPDSAAFVRSRPDYRELLTDPGTLDEIGVLDARFVKRFTDRVFDSPPEQIGTKENQAFVSLASTVWLHHWYVRGNARRRTPLGVPLYVVDRRSGALSA